MVVVGVVSRGWARWRNELQATFADVGSTYQARPSRGRRQRRSRFGRHVVRTDVRCPLDVGKLGGGHVCVEEKRTNGSQRSADRGAGGGEEQGVFGRTEGVE